MNIQLYLFIYFIMYIQINYNAYNDITIFWCLHQIKLTKVIVYT